MRRLNEVFSACSTLGSAGKYTFSGNDAIGFGGGMNNIDSSATLTNCTVCGNTPTGQPQVAGSYTDGGGNLIADECPPCVFADLDRNREVRVPDLVSLLSAWGPCPEPCAPQQVHTDVCPEDLTGNCKVRVPDLIMLLDAWGPCS